MIRGAEFAEMGEKMIADINFIARCLRILVVMLETSEGK